MAVIYLCHAIHGTKVACSDLEAAADRKLGWEDYDPTPRIAPAPLPAEPAATADDEQITALPSFLAAEPGQTNELRRGPGRPRKTH